MRLNATCAPQPGGGVALPGYDRARQAVGIVHFGIGAFHRAHQAVYTDDAMNAGDRDWAIVGVSLRSAAVRDQMNPQDGLYTLAERAPEGTRLRMIGAIKGVLVAREDPGAVIDALAAPDTRICSLTITEKGYCRGPDGLLDRANPDLAADLDGSGPPLTIYGFLRRGLALRRERGLPGLSVVCCDNLPENGRSLNRLLCQFLKQADPPLATWFDAHCACPSTMVDRIVPATTAADLDDVERLTGLRDQAAVVTETFRQWVIEDRFAGPRPRWELGGAQLVADVRPFELAKLRMLNGAHSALAYLGLLSGHAYVHEAVTDAAIRPVIDDLMLREAAPTLGTAKGLDPAIYAGELLARFANSALPHRLAQIAMDGSQKLPQRWLQTIAWNRAAGRECPALFSALVAWMLHASGKTGPVDDPLADRLAALWRDNGPRRFAASLFGKGGLMAASWEASADDLETLGTALEQACKSMEGISPVT